MKNLSPIEHKASIVAKELDTAFDVYNRHFTQLSTLRGWSLTLTLAYLGFLLTIKSNNFLTIIPFGFVLVFFMFLESGERINMNLNALEVQRVELIFMEKNPAKFTKMIQEYEFRDLRLEKQHVKWLKRIGERIRQMFTLRTIAWHLLLFLLIGITQVAIIFQIII